ncbi:unnamed protein product [Alternaria alternata]
MPMRPTSDKEVDVVDLDRLFEEYVQTDLLNHFGDCNPKQSSSGEPKHLFDSVLSNESQLFGSEPILDRETQAAWHKALEKYEQNPTPLRAEDSISSSYVTSSTGNESFSDSELLNLDDFFELERKQSRSISQPPTTRPHTSGRSVACFDFHKDDAILSTPTFSWQDVDPQDGQSNEFIHKSLITWHCFAPAINQGQKQ